MIVSRTGEFVFFHNPKAAGASIHRSLMPYHDNRIVGWGVAPDGREQAHYAIDEFARLFPEQWSTMAHYRFYAVYRDVFARFLSAFAQHSRLHGDVDIRFASEDLARSSLFRMIDRLSAYDCAEELMPYQDLVHFRPQWVYCCSEEHDIDIAAFPVQAIADLYRDMEARLGAELERVQINESKRASVPAPMRVVLQRGPLVRKVAGLPGASAVKALLFKMFPRKRQENGGFLSPDDRKEITAFLEPFYARDYEFMARRDVSGKAA